MLKRILENLLCHFGFHTWVICRMVDNKGKLINYHRDCEYCSKEQKLQRPEKYHPTAYVWLDVDTPIKNNNQLD